VRAGQSVGPAADHKRRAPRRVTWAAVARILIVGGGCRGRRLAAQAIADGHAVRATTRTEAGRAAIEALGAECWIGTPDRLATLRGALENVTIACWLLARASGGRDEVQALHRSRLEFFLGQAIDTTVRGLIYDASGSAVPRDALDEGERLVRSLGQLNAIPVAVLGAELGDDDQAWISRAQGAIDALLAGA
jgi:hypothetical protein